MGKEGRGDAFSVDGVGTWIQINESRKEESWGQSVQADTEVMGMRNKFSMSKLHGNLWPFNPSEAFLKGYFMHMMLYGRK